nr:hypothetical protein CFP56_67095 [Quercus suber]
MHGLIKASAEQHLRVFALEIVKGSDGDEEDVSFQIEYQRSQETSASGCQEEPMLNFRGNRGASGRNEGGGYLCSMISVLLMHTRPRVARVSGVIGCAATAMGFLTLIVSCAMEGLIKASAEQHLRVFALEIVKGSDGDEEDVSFQLEYQRSQETSAS